MIHDIILIIALAGITYATMFSVTITLMIAFSEPYKGLAVPVGMLVAAAVLYVAQGLI